MNFTSLPFTFPRLQLRLWCVSRSLTDLPNDVFLEEIFPRLDIWDIISLRRVNKRLHALTHEAVVWKRILLVHTNLAIPPLPPTSRYSMAALNDLEAERLLIRAISLNKNFRSKNPELMQCLPIESFHRVQSMAILPGGKYLVASVRDLARNCYGIITFALDYRVGGALPLAKTQTPTKAYNLKAKYMAFQGQKGIMISYCLRDTKDIGRRRAAGGIDLSEMSSEDLLDIPVPVKYTCTILFTPLTLTDHISDPAALPPGSETYNQFAMNQPPPFRLIATVSSASSLGPICLEEIFGAPYMAVVKGNDQILFKNLDMEGHSTLTCNSVDLPNRECAIVNIRFLPPEGSIFVVRRARGEHVRFETYPIPFLGEHVVDTDPVTVQILEGNDIERVEITENPPLSSRHGNAESPPDLVDQASRSISIFGITGLDPGTGERSLHRADLFAKRWTRKRPTPQVPFPLADEIENDPVAKKAFISKYTTYFYKLADAIETNEFPQDYGKMRVLPGSNYSLICWTADTVKECGSLTALGIYFTRKSPRGNGSFGVDDAGTAKKNSMVKLPCVGDTLWRELTAKPIKSIAWDESIGRMCPVHENDSRVFILDFAEAPKEDAKGERLPLPVTGLYQMPSTPTFPGSFPL